MLVRINNTLILTSHKGDHLYLSVIVTLTKGVLFVCSETYFMCGRYMPPIVQLKKVFIWNITSGILGRSDLYSGTSI